MRAGVGLLLSLAVVAIATPALAQLAPIGPSSDIWQYGTQPVPELYAPRQTPNAQPTAPAQPVSAQGSQAIWPSWYPQPPGTPLAGGTLYSGVTVGTFFDDNVFATNANRQSRLGVLRAAGVQWVKQGQNYTFGDRRLHRRPRICKIFL